SLPPSNLWSGRENDTNCEYIIRIFCPYGPDLKYSDGISHDWCTLIPALELAYKTSIHSSTGKTPSILEKGWNTILPYDTLQKDLLDIHPTAKSFKTIFYKERHHANRSLQAYFKYAKERWAKIHKPPELKVVDLILVSTLNLNNIKGPNKLEYSFSGPFMIGALHCPNAVQLEFTGKLIKKTPNVLSMSDKALHLK
ncbi:hypothetical protein O181_061861, partial [Austropuccinia psidii MF-1]|nr:hypothetical protein [Austropuccinia psidii MF-1]